jgi:small-conductance mechanosensitive channel
MRKPLRRWPWLILGQALILSILTALAVLTLTGADADGAAYRAMMWGVVPLSGAVTAFFAVFRGLNSFAAFWLPPVVQTAVHWLITGMPPLSAGMPLTAALVSIVGAAAGEEARRRFQKQNRRKK